MKYALLLALTVVSWPSLDAQTDFSASFIAIIVEDIEASIAWYDDILGFEVANRTDIADRGIHQVNMRRDGIALELIETRMVVGQDSVLSQMPAGSRIAGFFKFGFSVSEFDLWVSVLREAGARFQGSVVTDPLTDKRMVVVRDPDGNRIQLFEG